MVTYKPVIWLEISGHCVAYYRLGDVITNTAYLWCSKICPYRYDEVMLFIRLRFGKLQIELLIKPVAFDKLQSLLARPSLETKWGSHNYISYLTWLLQILDEKM